MTTQIRVRVQAGIAAGLPAPGPVVSVAGRTGAVVLDVSDVTGLSASLAGKAPINSPTFTGTVSGITASMVGAPSGSGTSSGTNTGDETETRIGTLIAAAADKATPVDADSLALSDSAAGGILRRFSWASLKAALNGVFARLAGVSGGQTLTGGTAASESLTLRSTSHATKGKVLLGTGAAYDETTTRLGIGTQSPAAELHAIATTEQLRLGYDASNYYSISVGASGVVTHTAVGGQHVYPATISSAVRGAELVVNGTFAADLSGWSDSGASWSWSAGTALHTAGSASTLSQSVTVTTGGTYQVEFTIGSRTAGSVSVSLGSVIVVNTGSTNTFTSSANYKRTVVAAGASGSQSFTITPSSDFDGSIDAVSVQLVTQDSVTPVLLCKDSAGSESLELRAFSLSLGATAFGVDCLSSLTVGSKNTSIGYQAGRSVSVGSSLTAVGYRAQYVATQATSCCAVGAEAQYALSAGSDNAALGFQGQYSLTTGSANGALGSFALYALTTGSYNTAAGHAALRNLLTTSNASALGGNAGRYLSDGVTSLTSATGCTYFGAATKASADSVTNENVFGYNATGIGSNSCVLGSSAVTKCQIFGDIILDKTVTAGGTTGAQTINKTVGSVNFAAGATSLVVTNNRVTTASVIIATVATNDTTLKSVVAVAGSGSFTLTANAAATAETRVNFIVIN